VVLLCFLDALFSVTKCLIYKYERLNDSDIKISVELSVVSPADLNPLEYHWKLQTTVNLVMNYVLNHSLTALEPILDHKRGIIPLNKTESEPIYATVPRCRN
jgi:hypothetical protein